MSLEENLTKWPKCSIDFTGRGRTKEKILILVIVCLNDEKL
jgi:hypothetical protein